MSAESSELGFWEFVCCSKCYLSFSNGAGPTVPFWLTECGHVICNNHLNHDQSCARCGTRGIQLVPLQQDMEPPMSEWFRSVPLILDSAAFAVKFQQDSMAAQIRHLKARQQQFKGYIDKLKRENAQLKQTNEMLNIQLSGIHGPNSLEHEPANYNNSNGKRQMTDLSRASSMSSSPHGAIMPVGPPRITLPPGQHPPQLASNEGTFADENVPPRSQYSERPGSSRFVERFAYSPVKETQMRAPQLSHAQAAPKQFRRPLLNAPSQSRMPPPPVPSKFGSSSDSNTFFSVGEAPASSRNSAGNQTPSLRPATQVQSTNHLLPLNERFPPPPGTPAVNAANNPMNSRRFVPPSSGRSGTFRPVTSHPTVVPSSSTWPQPNYSAGSGSGQRMPFVPGK
ncbi:hypothetical protein D9757_003716 [Collybiopsis confluens]|uniref:RING-type domain-containing protein n=1 Tax=Collybiopsis confluens TaxID=2823264 RepID=A0A8H5HUN7_9AGAR|nr:hypothetical protein D9757_003716 [Collybiopsis confluens]